MDALASPPEWLRAPVRAVLEDLQGAQPIAGLQVIAAPIPGLNGVSLTFAMVTEELAPLPDDLDPHRPTEYGGGNWVPRSLAGPELVVLVAEILQEELAETTAAWGQARPPCPAHSHPAAPAVQEGEAWWTCPGSSRPLYRIGRGERPR